MTVLRGSGIKTRISATRNSKPANQKDKWEGKRLRTLRKERGLLAKYVAFEMGIKATYLCMLEAGERHWTDDLITKYVAAITPKPVRFVYPKCVSNKPWYKLVNETCRAPKAVGEALNSLTKTKRFK